MSAGQPPAIAAWKTHLLETARDRLPDLMTELDQGRLPDGWKDELMRVLNDGLTSLEGSTA